MTTSFKEQALSILEREIDRLEYASENGGLDQTQLQMLSEMVSAYAKVAATVDARKVLMRQATRFKKTDSKTLVDCVKDRLARRNQQQQPSSGTEPAKTE